MDAGEAWGVADRHPSALFKVLIVGAHGVGKTSLCRALTVGGFVSDYQPGFAGEGT